MGISPDGLQKGDVEKEGKWWDEVSVERCGGKMRKWVFRYANEK